MSFRGFAPASALVAMTVVVLLALGCGGDNEPSAADTAAQQQAVETRVARERAEAARVARQEERLKQVERELEQAQRRPAARTVTTQVVTPAPTAAPASSESTTFDDWPGGSAHTVILASSATEAAARAIQRRASNAGLDAGVLFSSSYRSLRPGYWVTFSGAFPWSRAAAQRRARARRLGFGSAYVRFVSP